jgi:hypothetical protein
MKINKNTKEEDFNMKEKENSLAEEEAGKMEKTQPLSQTKKSQKKKWIIIALLGVLFCLIFAGGVWAFSLYDRINTNVSMEKLLPQADAVIRVVIKEDSEQIRLLQDLFQRFPGYSYLRKELDSVGEGRDVDESFLKSWDSFGLSFEEDISPAIGEYAWISIPDLTPVEKVFGERIAQVFDGYQDQKFAVDLPEEKTTRVLGEMEEWGYVSENEALENDYPEEVDYIMGVEVKDKKKLQEVVEKIYENSDRFTFEERKYSSYPYYVLRINEDDQKDEEEKEYDIPLVLRSDETFYALIGSSWMVSSREEWLLGSIRRHASHRLTSFIPKEGASLNESESYKEIMNRFGDKDELVSLYYEIDTEILCDSDYLCSQAFSSQGSSQGSGFSIRLSEEGINLYSENIVDEEGLSQKKNAFDGGTSRYIPKQAGKYWADVFGEISDMKNSYYDSKRHFLSEEGEEELEKIVDEMYATMGIHLERDFVDKTQGDLGFSLFSEKQAFPIGMLVVEMENGLDFAKELLNYTMVLQKSQYDAYVALCEEQPPSVPFCASLEEPNMELVEEELTAGRLFRIEGGNGKDPVIGIADMELCAGLSNDGPDRVYIASSCVPIRTMFDSGGISEEDTLAFDEEYQISQSYVGKEGYSRSHIVPLGVFYSIYGIYFSLMGTLEGDDSDSSQEDIFYNDPVFVGIEGIVKTIPSITSQSQNRGSSTTFIHIKELPKDEKERAEAGIERMMSGLTNARASAEQARFKSTMTSHVPAVIICCDGGESVSKSPTSGSLLCGSQDIQTASAEEFGFDSTEYKVMKNCSIDDQSFKIHINAKGAGTCSGTTILTEVGVEFPQGC